VDTLFLKEDIILKYFFVQVLALNPALLSWKPLVFSSYAQCRSIKHCPSSRGACVAEVTGADLDRFAIGAVLLNHNL
jgi:hypothetical protein